MNTFEVIGGKTLSGEIVPQGAKNEALQVISAVMLTPEKVTISNVPDIVDVNRLIELLADLGVEVTKIDGNTYTFKADNVDLDYISSAKFMKQSSSLRGSVMLIGPILARFGKAYMPKPGGDKIGRRRIDTHIIGFQKLGAEFEYNFGNNIYKIHADRLKGCDMLLEEASVTGTANIIMAAVLAKGTTTIFNAACEPYVVQLCNMLNRMGAKISGVKSNYLTI